MKSKTKKAGVILYVWRGRKRYEEVHWFPGKVLEEDAKMLALVTLRSDTTCTKVQVAYEDRIIGSVAA